MFSFIRKMVSILFILVIYFMIITFFSLAKEPISFDQLYPVSPVEQLNKIFSYQFQFIRNYQVNGQSPEEFDKFCQAMLNSSVDLNTLLFEIEKTPTNLPETNLNQFLADLNSLYRDITKNYCDLEKVICIKVLLQEAQNKLEKIYATNNQMKPLNQS